MEKLTGSPVTRSNTMENKQVRITDAAQAKMKSLKEEGQDFKIQMINSCWSGPEFRLVQTDKIADDAVSFTQGDIKVFVDADTLSYMDILDIGLFEAYGEEMLLVEENLI